MEYFKVDFFEKGKDGSQSGCGKDKRILYCI